VKIAGSIFENCLLQSIGSRIELLVSMGLQTEYRPDWKRPFQHGEAEKN